MISVDETMQLIRILHCMLAFVHEQRPVVSDAKTCLARRKLRKLRCFSRRHRGALKLRSFEGRDELVGGAASATKTYIGS